MVLTDSSTHLRAVYYIVYTISAVKYSYRTSKYLNTYVSAFKSTTESVKVQAVEDDFEGVFPDKT